jgi:hypothetical protein
VDSRHEDFPTFFNVRENIAWTSRGDVIGWPADSRGPRVVFAFSGSSHHLPETEVVNRCEFRNGLEFGGGIEKALTRSAGIRGNMGRHSGVPQVSHLPDSSPAEAEESVFRTEGRMVWSQGRPVFDNCHGGDRHTGNPRVDLIKGRIPSQRGSRQATSVGHEFPIRVSTQRSISGSYAAHWTSARVEWSTTREGRFLLKPIEETAQCIVTIRD